jgi:uncharacterized protein (TIGR02147 family)
MIESTYRRLFKDAYLERRERNPSYSIRAFAKQLELSPAFVTLVFQGKRHLSPKIAGRVARKLKWSDQKQKYFLNLIEFENPKTEVSREAAIEQIVKFNRSKLKIHSLNAELFAVISVWYHNAILALLTMKNSKHTVATIAQRLKLDKLEAEAALYRLKNLGLVQLNGTEWNASNNLLEIKSIPSEALKSYQSQMLKKAADALRQQSFEEREISGLTITVDTSQLELAKTKIREFKKEMACLLEGTNATEVYELSIQLFRLTQPEALSKGVASL